MGRPFVTGVDSLARRTLQAMRVEYVSGLPCMEPAVLTLDEAVAASASGESRAAAVLRALRDAENSRDGAGVEFAMGDAAMGELVREGTAGRREAAVPPSPVDDEWTEGVEKFVHRAGRVVAVVAYVVAKIMARKRLGRHMPVLPRHAFVCSSPVAVHFAMAPQR